MAMTGSEFKSYIASEVKKYEGVYVPLKASLLERAVKRSARTIDLHPNPDDEFSFPNIGPHDGIIAKYERRFRDTGKVKENPWDDSIMVQKIHPNGYMILNGHHRWAAALRADIKRVPISIINLLSHFTRQSDSDAFHIVIRPSSVIRDSPVRNCEPFGCYRFGSFIIIL